MEAFLVSALAVAIAELGDKTHLLALLLAVRFQRLAPVAGGILAATIANSLLAAVVGAAAATLFEGIWFRWLLALSFVAVGVWALIPDKDGQHEIYSSRNAFLTAAVTFFLTEMADKTQVATAMLAASFGEVLAVAAGSALGMMAVNAPTVWLGGRFAERLPLRAIRVSAALIFVALGVWVALG